MFTKIDVLLGGKPYTFLRRQETGSILKIKFRKALCSNQLWSTIKGTLSWPPPQTHVELATSLSRPVILTPSGILSHSENKVLARQAPGGCISGNGLVYPRRLVYTFFPIITTHVIYTNHHIHQTPPLVYTFFPIITTHDIYTEQSHFQSRHSISSRICPGLASHGPWCQARRMMSACAMGREKFIGL